jgi:hypothetical protein
MKNEKLDYTDYCDIGYEVLAHVDNADIATDYAEFCFDSGFYKKVVVVRYKGKPGQEDSYSILGLIL